MAYHLNIKSDIFCENDLLGFEKYIDTLSGMIRDRDFKTPFCIGIFGKWGSGKTSFMHLLEKKLIEDTAEPHAVPVWFNPWRYEKEEHLIIPFLKTIEHEIERYRKGIEQKEEAADTKSENKKIWQTFSDKLRGFSETIGEVAEAFAYGLKVDCKLGGAGIELDASKMIDKADGQIQNRIENAKALSKRLSSKYYEIVSELKNAVDEKTFRIVAFIDDLDRCLPEKAVELLEAIKLFLDIEGYLFVIGVDKNVVKKGISYRYRFFEHKEEGAGEELISPEDYLDKMIQLPLELPVIEPGKKRSFIESLFDTDEFKEHADIIDIGIGENPRSLKRFINLLAFTVNLAETVKDNILNDAKENAEHKALLKNYFIPLLYIKWVIIVFRFPKLHNDIKGNWRKLIELQDAARSEAKTETADSDRAAGRSIQLDERLKKVFIKGEQFPDNEWLTARFIHLTESTVIREKGKAADSGYRQSFQPGDMVLIPKGKFLYGDEKIQKDVPDDYFIDVFHVTNKQYKAFIDDEAAYDVPYREEEWAKPYNWDKEKRTFPEGLENHPVVLVSYNDAVEFCNWRSKKEGKEFRLPTEEEWEKAARGEDGRAYPWGDEFDFNKLNCADYHVGKNLHDIAEWEKLFRNDFYEKNKARPLTTNVGSFPDGASPYKCHDMAGNVREWTDSWYDNDKKYRVRRGGSWDSNHDSARCAYRSWGDPDGRGSVVGFRCARTL